MYVFVLDIGSLHKTVYRQTSSQQTDKILYSVKKKEEKTTRKNETNVNGKENMEIKRVNKYHVL